MMEKYAYDLNSTDKIIDRHNGRVIEIEHLESNDVAVQITAHYEDNGDPYDRSLILDAPVKVV